jgi:DNA polymerase-1
VSLDLPALQVGDFVTPELIALFRELEFRRFLEEVETLAGATPKTEEPVDYHTVDQPGFSALLERLKSVGKLAIDLETTSLDTMVAQLVGISVAVTPNEAFYIPVGHTEEPDLASSAETPANMDLERVLAKLKPILENEEIEKYGQNLKYDTAVLMRYGIEPKGFVFDTMVAAYLINPSARQHSLDALSSEYLSHKMIPITDLIGKGKDQKSFAEVPIDTATTYSCEDADVALRLKELFEPKLRELYLMDLFEKVEMPLVPVLRDMELAGVSVDVEFLNAMSQDLQRDMDRMTEGIYKSAGEPFNVNSTQQLAHILFDKLGLKPKRKTKTGYSTDVDVLEALSAQHELPRKLLEYRELAKLKSTYADALPKMIHPLTGRIHASFNQTVTATGRLSSSDPNLQNIPVRTETGREIRKAFVPADPSWVLLSADYSQIELRIMAHLSGDQALIEAFRSDEDIHTRTASLIFGLFPQFITPDLRRQAKTINFGIIYGMGPYGLARQLSISVKEARDFIDRYFATYPGVKSYTTQTVEEAQKNGFVTTLMGRRRYLPELASSNTRIREFGERTAVNTPIQGTAADLIKIAMINIARRLKQERLQAKMILQVHDELVFEVPKTQADATRALVTEEMANALELSVPIKVDCGVGTNWLEAH